MNKAVMISIHPKWCELIANGKKTVEVRKTRPKLEMPFKVYIYCTQQGRYFYHGGLGEKQNLFKNPDTGKIKFDFAFELMCCEKEYTEDNFLSGKVIGEFVCDYIDELHEYELTPQGEFYLHEKARLDLFLEQSCLSYGKICDYRKNLPCHKPLYAWKISNLVIYDKPKDLSEFRCHCKYEFDDDFRHCDGCNYHYFANNPSSGREEYCSCDGLKPLTRPPQSWCYVEEQK